MRIVIDMQGAQTDSRFRGIGRYSMSLALAVARNAGDHEIWLVLNAALPQSIPDIRRAFSGLVPKERIRVFDIPTPVAEHDEQNAWRTRAAEKIREHVIAQLRPDMVLVTSLFEGYVDNGIASVGSFCNGMNTAVILYDLIPLLNPDAYLPMPSQKASYYRKVASLKNAGLLLAISDYSRQEAIEALQLDPSRVVSISTATDPRFTPAELPADELDNLRSRYGITRQMVMYAPGGFDARKNIDGLMKAFSMLPQSIRASHQLVIASKIGDAERFRLVQMRKQAGLSEDELVLTGYVPDDDLCALYGAAALFVFPSKHEGFGLPALEAMACGAPVIGSDRTSVPEVIGRQDALFDPHSPQAIAAKMEQVLSDKLVQDDLREHGREQAKKFSWDASAKRALRAMEAHASAMRASTSPVHNDKKLRLAFVSPLPPERTGIADYSADLLPELSRLYDVELITDQVEVDLPPGLLGLPRRSVSWFTENAAEFDRIVYQVGNSPFHTHMFALLREHPGAVVLHDFFLSGVLAHEELTEALPGVWTEALYHSHGYAALQMRFDPRRVMQARDVYPSNLEVLQNARGVIVHSEHSRRLACEWYGPDAGGDWKLIPLLRTPAATIDRSAARAALGIPENAFVVCSFGFVDGTKCSHRLLDAWLSSNLAAQPDCYLTFVGENHGGDYGAQMLERIRTSGCGDRIRITGWANAQTYRQFLQAADAGVQLRSMSRGETSAAVLDCMNYGLPTIANANGSMADLPDSAVLKLPDAFTDAMLVTALERLKDDAALRHALGTAARELIHQHHHPAECARRYEAAIESAYETASTDVHALVQALSNIPELPASDDVLRQLAQSVALSSEWKPSLRQLLVDVSAISRNDLQTGIERVVRAQLFELLQNPPSGFRVEPVYLTSEGGAWHYRYAHMYTHKLLSIPSGAVIESPVDVGAADVFYSPDFYPHGTIEAASSGLYADWRARGVEVNFLVHDILPVLQPQFFPDHADEVHARWLTSIAKNADRIVCISQAVSGDVSDYLRQESIDPGQLEIAVVHHGADIKASVPSSGLPDEASAILGRLASRPSFLMVGTIEPRKGHLQAIAAFEHLWREGVDANLVIVGKEGWKPLPHDQRRTIPQIVERMSTHPELGKRLLWLQGISDEYLQHLYESCACLIFASEGEGFGLPLIEAAQNKLPIISRDLPVFREVAGMNAYYFSGLEAEDLAVAVKEWLALRERGSAPSSSGMRWRTWAENARELATILSGRSKLLCL
ncbi:MAG TPA: glycosyltransferase [Noviherbaspirillum sp.]|nr:glycosyltransferase [Noviherbaspirillum sp.]